jgi:hypothetical protein
LFVGGSVLRGADSATAKREFKDYGVVAIQRRANGSIWIVVSGLSGPATLGAACVINTMTEHLPPANSGGYSKTRLVLVETIVRLDGAYADPRSVVDYRIVPDVFDNA